MKLPKSPNINEKKLNNLKFGGIPYNQNISELRSMILDLNNSNLKFKDQFRNLIIVNIVTLIEDVLKHQIKDFVDRNDLDILNLIDENKLQHSTWTKGSIVATNFNFQNLQDLDIVYSKLLELDFLSTIEELILQPDKTGANEFFLLYSFSDKNALKKNWNEFRNMFNHRHEIIHTIDKKVTYSVGGEFYSKANFHDTKYPKLNTDYINKILNSTEIFLCICMTLPEKILHFHKINFILMPTLFEFLSKKINKK